MGKHVWRVGGFGTLVVIGPACRDSDFSLGDNVRILSWVLDYGFDAADYVTARG